MTNGPAAKRLYQAWAVECPMEYVEADTSLEARKKFARKHKLDLSECMARLMDRA